MSEKKTMTLYLKIWRQQNSKSLGRMESYTVEEANEDMSFLELLDLLNEKLITQNADPVAFDHDCREGICGMCSLMIDGRAHGPRALTTTCQLHLREFEDGDTIVIEPWRSKAFPVLKDLMVDRSSFDEVMAAGGYVSVNTGHTQDANALLVPKEKADKAMDAASCIGCGACVAACPNGSAMLFVAAKVSQLALLPQGSPEKKKRAFQMVNKMDELGFGNCTNAAECEASCPKGIDLSHIARMNRLYAKACAKGTS
ncbi:MAG: succinate dehydrogenase/fumarate reductase iron-sulfur subunit [Bacteriovoracales bacterium]|nr:succinate dehydrogenase/fumarate reductase iron-sulfur subunit [Bacteriovoracales bacterium]